jgi:hypothetical protein
MATKSITTTMTIRLLGDILTSWYDVRKLIRF